MPKARTEPIAYQSALKDATMDAVLPPINVSVSQDSEELRAQNLVHLENGAKIVETNVLV